ncbi:MAG TPA: acetate/propionate family kinase [Bryobacteraceae bacterium]|nr:acetate/propionate family kinase [Bryobacteraceae bacterium]
MKILVVNAGSSSLKCWYHDLRGDALDTPPAQPLWSKHVDWDEKTDIEATFASVLQSLPGPVELAGHRIVHGGRFRGATKLTPEVRAAIAEETAIAPAHNRIALKAVDILQRRFGADVTQAAVFDTGFHATLPPEAYVYPGPYAWFGAGIRRYGFHGISHGYAARRAAQILGGDSDSLRIITCHLGSGASLAAVRGGKSIDTTMGFTPLEGLMMGSRSGSVDPGVLVYLLRQHNYTADQIDDILYKQSGLLGISGISSDMREILAAIDRGDSRAQLAFDIYLHRLVREIGSMLAVLGGADAVVFTGGVGENCAPLRDRVAQQLTFLPNLRVLVIHAEEEWEIARQCYELQTGSAGGPDVPT